MPCYHPLKAYGKPGGGISFSATIGCIDKPMELPCGQCIGCRINKQKQWAIRCVHEMKMHKHNTFITLTYDDQRIEEHHQAEELNKVDFQKFMKRLRKKYGKGIRYFHCGEYGDKKTNNYRPHHHAILFGHCFTDQKRWKKSDQGKQLYRSEQLEKLWQYGNSDIGEANFDTAKYIAKYTTKVYNESKASPVTPEEFTNKIQQPFATMSRRPGIGSTFYDRYKDQIYTHDYTVINGKHMKPPLYYDRKYKEEEPRKFRSIQANRFKKARENEDFENLDRLYEKEMFVKLVTQKR
jgi:hypothetical protein